MSTSMATSTRTHESLGPLDVVLVAVEDPRLQPLFDELRIDYSARYPEFAVGEELQRFPADEFQAPFGAFIAVIHGSDTVAGGAFRRYDATTAEMKRIWVSSAHRRHGLGRLVMAELESLADAYGYHNAYLTTGPRQPEARALYLGVGYTPLFDVAVDPETIGALPFTKVLRTHPLNPSAVHRAEVDA